jgi:hypothetical protein
VQIALPYSTTLEVAMLLRSLAVWLGLLVVAFLNGAMRVLWLTPAIGDHAAHVASAIVLSVIVFAVTWIAIRWIHPHNANEALLVGDEWVLLTIGFEFLAGYYLFGNSWERLLSQYNVAAGETWEVVLVAMLIAPLAAAYGHRALWRMRHART